MSDDLNSYYYDYDNMDWDLWRVHKLRAQGIMDNDSPGYPAFANWLDDSDLPTLQEGKCDLTACLDAGSRWNPSRTPKDEIAVKCDHCHKLTRQYFDRTLTFEQNALEAMIWRVQKCERGEVD